MGFGPCDDSATDRVTTGRPLIGGAAMGAVSRISVAVSGAVTMIFVARLLGTEDTGSFALALTVINMLTVITTLGIEHGVAYYVSGGKWRARDAFVVSQRMALISGTVGALLGLAFSLVVPAPFKDLSTIDTAIACFALPFALAWFYGSYVALADDRYEGFVLPPAIQSVAGMVLAVALGVPFGLRGAIVGLLGAHALAALFVWYYRRHLSDPEPPAVTEPTSTQLTRALSFGIKGYASNALQVLNYRVDVLLLSSVAGSAAVGPYAIAAGITTTLWLLPQAVSDILFPRVASLSARADEDAEAHRRFVETKSLRHVVLLVIVGSAALAVGMYLLVVPLYGTDFRDAIELGMIRLPGVALLGIAGVLSASYVGRGRPILGLYSALIVTPATMALYAVLIPAHGATGAALASSLSFALSFVLAVLFYRVTVGEPIWRRMIPTYSEVQDYFALVPQIRARLATIRSRGR